MWTIFVLKLFAAIFRYTNGIGDRKIARIAPNSKIDLPKSILAIKNQGHPFLKLLAIVCAPESRIGFFVRIFLVFFRCQHLLIRMWWSV